ncbi:MAG: glycoside hydrolase [Campylobacterales bacterium]|nr:glycoside hydrolase [Campylobacterales bacterium]
MKKLYLAFLWHMHQPYYKDSAANATLMPWVFLHTIKDYYDIPWYLSKYPSIKATFNLVPSLLEQIQSYCQGKSKDRLITTLKYDIASLNQNDLALLESYIFAANVEQMIKPLPRYHELYLKYASDERSLKNFSNAEILDAQVLFLLSWCGNYLRSNCRVVKQFLEQGRGFNHIQKVELIDALLKFMEEVIPYYKNLAAKKQIAISTTPYYHPILPLLIDRKSAKEAKESVVLPRSQANYEEFATKNMSRAIELYEKLFDQKPKGIWPSEGSVSQATIELLANQGIKWACSDEAILFRSIKSSHRNDLFKPYHYISQDGKAIHLFFRDHYLSDLIGFEYSRKEAKEAAKHFVEHLRNIYLNHQDSMLVSVILDGENAWEFYPNNAMDFFEALYELLESEEWCQTLLYDNIEEYQDLSMGSLDKVASGSWINGNFDIWIGSNDKNMAWELLDGTKNLYDRLKNNFDEATQAKIEEEFMIALGSDWFWWYGDDHYTAYASQFDEQFRGHIKNIYLLMHERVPPQVFAPIVTQHKEQCFHIAPLDYILPQIDGKTNNFYEWLNCGYIDLKRELSTMSTTLFIEEVLYGKDRDNALYLLLKGEKLKNLSNNTLLTIYFNDKIFPIPIQKGIHKMIVNTKKIVVGYADVIEIKVEECTPHRSQFSCELNVDGKVEQKSPLYEDITLYFENFNLKKWYI